MTGYVARKELSSLSAELTSLEDKGILKVHDVKRNSPAGKRFEDLKRRAHKGEAEAVAWAVECDAPESILFISNDNGARRLSLGERIATGDVLDLLIEFIDDGCIAEAEAKALVHQWDDPGRPFGRPAGFTGFDETIAKRRTMR